MTVDHVNPGRIDTIIYLTPLGDFEAHAADVITRDAFTVMPSGTCKWWSPEVSGWLLERQEIGTYIDVGAHIGMTTIPLARQWRGKRGAPEQFAFEPTPLNHYLLGCNVRRNGLVESIHVERLAVSDRPGKVTIAGALFNTHDHRVVNPATPLIDGGLYDTKNRQRFEVEAVTLDSYFAGRTLRRPIVLKMDVQGHELAVLRGARVLKPDFVVMEYWPYGLLQAGERREEFFTALREFSRGALAVNDTFDLVPAGHVVVASTLRWDGIATTAVDLVMER